MIANERDDYSYSAWNSDLINIIKNRGWFVSRKEAWEIFNDNFVDFMECYAEGMSPIEAYSEYEGE